jgi:hypothetical protein
MPPKKAQSGEKKAVEKKKEKVADDKTFGLKNKNKSKAVQKYIASVKQNVKQVNGQRPVSEHEIRSEKKKDQERAQLLNSLFGNLGILETKKKKKKAEDDKGKIDLYVDQRDQQGEANGEEDNMADWDQEKLEKVVGQRHGAQAKQCQTDIICKFFLDAVEKGLYGWFWVCPNGGDTCKYRHSLPPGYVLKKAAPVEEEDEEDEITIEDQIEMERAALPSGGTPVTEESFKQWLIMRAETKRDLEEKERQAIIDASAKRGQKGIGLSGRDLFTYDPSLFVDDDGAAGQDLYGDLEDPNMVFTDDPDLYDEDEDLEEEDEDEDLEDDDDSDDSEYDDEEHAEEPAVSAPQVVPE